jgi:glycosyltransferase involved in cell wall biosynthesis
MACGTPVVSTTGGSLKEVVGNSAIMVSPDHNSLKKGMETALKLSSAHRQKLIQSGIKQAKKFSWEKTAINTIKVYEKVLAS